MTKKFLYTNTELDAQISSLQKAIRLSMNGVVADSMADHGLHYKKNYGVSTLRLKEIAHDYTPGVALAERLWLLGIRETMILATLLAPAESFPEHIAENWSRECTNQELIEQANMNLFQHLPYAASFALKCINSDTSSLQSFGFTLALRKYTHMNEVDVRHVVQRGIALSSDSDSYLIKTIAACLARFCRINRSTAQIVQDLVNQSITNESVGLTIIRKFVDNELIFLGYEQDNP